MLGLIERLVHVRSVGIDPGRAHRVHQARLAQLAREAGRTTVQHLTGYERLRRHATLVAVTLDLSAQAVDLFDRRSPTALQAMFPEPCAPSRKLWP